MTLFIIDGTIVKPTPEVLLLSPFREIWERDFSDRKENAIKDFSYIEFTTSPKKTNPFAGYSEKERGFEVRRAIGYYYNDIVDTNNPIDFEPDILVKDGILKYKEFLTNASPSLRLLLGAKEAMRKLEEFFNTVDLNEKSEKGALLYKPRDITNALQDVEKISISISNLQKKVEQELLESSRNKANRETGDYEE